MQSEIQKIIRVLNQGGVVIYPTDTAFGIGCRIDKKDSIKKLFDIRRRPYNQAVPVLFNSIDMINKYVQNIDEEVNKLMDKYWPGALTIILPAKIENISDLVRGGGETIGVRIPNHKAILQVINEIGIPILAPSANFHGEKTPLKFEDLDKEIIGKVDYVLRGECSVKQPSTVIDCSVGKWRIVRKGAIEINL